MNELTIIRHNGGAYIDSREVAEIIGKRHDNLLRDIAGYLRIFDNSIALKIEGNKLFVESYDTDSRGRVLPCYLLTKAGCSMVANKFTGEKGIIFTAAYVLRFEELEVAEKAAEIAAYHPKLNAFNDASRIIVRAYQSAGATSGQIVEFLENVYKPIGIKVLSDGLEGSDLPVNVYSPYKIAEQTGVFTLNGNPHSWAVGAVMRKLDISPEHKIITPVRYGEYIGVTLRYDTAAYLKLMNWFEMNSYPREIESDYCVYHVRYGSGI
ncbi:hypothetical protein FACS1894105_05540 [Clostridia bacterium]|nr:hypothetical protein FACS1894105_05540 [Clostridia bacterium]